MRDTFGITPITPMYERNGMERTTYMLAVCALLLSFSVVSFATELTKKEIERSVAITIDSCTQKQKSDPANDYFSGSQIREYCECYANKFYGLITKEELDYSNKYRTMNNITDKLDQAKTYCQSSLSEKWGQSSNKHEYVAILRTNIYSTCLKNTTSGADPIPASISRPLCKCYAETFSNTFSIAEIKEADANPKKFAPRFEKIMKKCAQKITPEPN